MHQRRNCSRVLSACLLLALAERSQAASLVPRDLRQVTAASAAIVHATVLDSKCRWNRDHTIILTETRIRPVEVLKGHADAELVVTSLGGTIGKLQVDVPGTAPLRAGEEVILFLVRDPDGTNSIEGLSRGRFEVVVDGRTGERVVEGGLAEQLQAALRPDAAPKSAPRPANALGSVLQDLHTLVRDVAAKGGR